MLADIYEQCAAMRAATLSNSLISLRILCSRWKLLSHRLVAVAHDPPLLGTESPLRDCEGLAMGKKLTRPNVDIEELLLKELLIKETHSKEILKKYYKSLLLGKRTLLRSHTRLYAIPVGVG